MSDRIDITGLDKAEVLAALYNASKPLGMGIIHYTPGDLDLAVAREYLAESPHFDYLHGRVMKVNLSSDSLDPRLYDRDNGQGAALAALAPLLAARAKAEG